MWRINFSVELSAPLWVSDFTGILMQSNSTLEATLGNCTKTFITPARYYLVDHLPIAGIGIFGFLASYRGAFGHGI
jgi:hypothetical protein